jgi:hypothetical protein
MGQYEIRAAFRRGSGLWIEMDPARSQWTAAARLIDQDGALAVAELRVFPRPSDIEDHRRPLGEPEPRRLSVRGGITTRVVRAIPLGTFTKAAESYLRKVTHEETREVAADERLSTAGRQRRGRILDAFLVYVVQAYACAREQGDSRGVHKAVAKELKLTPGRVRDLICIARKRGLMTRALAQGKGGGDLTPKGRAVLRATLSRPQRGLS